MKRLDVGRLATDERSSDVVIIGTGVAGLRAALGLAPRRVTVLTKSAFAAGGSSPWAQGGVAAAMGSDDSPRLHALDTLAAGAGLSTASTVATLTEEGPEQIRQLIDLGADFDRDADGRISLGREGAHQRRRVLHADGDATGAEVVRSLAAAVRQQGCAIFEHAEATDLVLADDGSYPGRVIGVLADHGSGRQIFHRAGAVILATGGFGQVYARTTNPRENTGDGLVMAARAGARLADLEMVQFHPTALDVTADPLPLVTEALRGEGAVLIDQAGHRFMVDVHELAELAPRDIVSRAIWRLQSEGGPKDGGQAFLDAREAVGAAFPERFPTVFEACQRHGIDPRTQPIPVTPAAHYTMAGVAADEFGRSSLQGLWACGEVTSTGIHGANRLASNSLLEALVFGARVASDIATEAVECRGPGVVKRDIEGIGEVADTARVRDHLRDRIRELMWRSVGLVRNRQGLEDALATLRALATDGVAAVGETRNLLTIGILVTAAALVREESRGGHYRTDFPRPDIVWQRRLLWTYKPTRHRQSPLEAVLQQHDSIAREIA